MRWRRGNKYQTGRKEKKRNKEINRKKRRWKLWAEGERLGPEHQPVPSAALAQPRHRAGAKRRPLLSLLLCQRTPERRAEKRKKTTEIRFFQAVISASKVRNQVMFCELPGWGWRLGMGSSLGLDMKAGSVRGGA